MTLAEKAKRDLAVPLLFLGLALAAAGSVDASPARWASALVVLWTGSLCLPKRVPSGSSPWIACAVPGLAAWIVVTNLWASPSYSAAAPYHAAFLLGGFLIGRRAGAEAAPQLFKAALAFALALAAWALSQAYMDDRARGPFVTPATFATVVNLVLLPTLVLVVAGARRAVLLAALGVLCSALIVSTSRGGWLALAGAAVAMLFFFHRARLPVARGVVAVLGALLGLAFVAAWIGSFTLRSLTTVGAAIFTLESRLEMYRLVIASFQPSMWLLGAGYDAFYYLHQANPGSVPMMAGGTTYFVHNDYLQTLYAFGVPGFAALLLLVIAPVTESWRKLPGLPQRERLTAVAALAATASMAVHALVDFPFFIPACVLMYGAALGTLDATLHGAAPRALATLPSAWKRALKAAVVTLAAWILAMPAAAEAAAAYAGSRWREAQGESAAYWFEVARRLQPRDWRYHWYAGQFWYVQAGANRNPEAARLADAAFAAGFAANPREVRNLLGRISTHLRLRDLLAAPADAATLREWADRALALAPQDRVVQAERRLVLQGRAQ